MKLAAYTDDLPAHPDPVIAHEATPDGWRGLSSTGELLDVRSRNGEKPEAPNGSMIVMRDNVAVSRRAIEKADWRIDDYLDRYNRSLIMTSANRPAEALLEIDAAITIAPTLFARFNRAMILLALGRWREGFEQYCECETAPALMRPLVKTALERGIALWRGEDLCGRRLLLLHAHGYGDTIMTLRYVQMLESMGAEIKLVMPAALAGLAQHFAPVVSEVEDADYFCPMLHLIGALGVMPAQVVGKPYIPAGPRPSPLRDHQRVGIAWSCGYQSTSDYPRSIPLGQVVAALGNAELHSVQTQRSREALELGVLVHEFRDFADCAALMMSLDRIVSVDTAALHLAGAIGHPNVTGLLSHWHSWRWLAPWYGNVKLCRQSAPNDWSSALAQF